MLRLTAILLLAAAPALGAPVSFTSARGFRAAAGATVIERFEGCGRETEVFTGALSAAGNTACAAGAIRAGVTFADDAGPYGEQMYLAGPRYGANRTTALGQNDPSTDALNILFDAPVRAIGFTVFQNVGGGATLARALPVTIALFGAGDAEIGRFVVDAGPRGGFFGAVADGAEILKVSIDNPLSYDMVDDVRFTAPALPGSLPLLNLDIAVAAPAPGTAMLFGLGALMTGWRSRRR